MQCDLALACYWSAGCCLQLAEHLWPLLIGKTPRQLSLFTLFPFEADVYESCPLEGSTSSSSSNNVEAARTASTPTAVVALFIIIVVLLRAQQPS